MMPSDPCHWDVLWWPKPVRIPWRWEKLWYALWWNLLRLNFLPTNFESGSLAGVYQRMHRKSPHAYITTFWWYNFGELETVSHPGNQLTSIVNNTATMLPCHDVWKSVWIKVWLLYVFRHHDALFTSQSQLTGWFLHAYHSKPQRLTVTMATFIRLGSVPTCLNSAGYCQWSYWSDHNHVTVKIVHCEPRMDWAL